MSRKPKFEIRSNGSFEFEIPSHTSDWQDAQAAIVTEMEKHSGFAQRDIFGVRLSLEEAFLNGIKHGNKGGKQKIVTARGHIGPERTWVSIEDEGEGFNPSELPDPTDPKNLDKPSGRGIMLMCAFLSAVSFNERGNKLWIERTPSPEPEDGDSDEHKAVPITVSDETPAFAAQDSSSETMASAA